MNKEINLGNLIIPIIKPQKGKDYYTETEKQELISIVTDNVNAGVLPQEQTRQSNEIIRQNNEQTRQAQETIRQTNETNRQTAETERESAENTRQRNESSRVSAEQTRTQTFNNKMDAVDTAIAGIHTSQNAYDQNATAKTSAFNENATSKTSDYNTNATNKTAEYNENASTKIAEYDAHIRDYEAELATKVDKVIGKGLSSNDFTNEEKAKLAELHNYDDTELSERVDDIEQEQTEQNTNISNNATNIESLQEENENLKKIVSQLPQVTGQGTSITLENTIEAQFTKFDVEGNSVQETTTGKNKLPNNATSQTINGVNFTVNDDGTVVANGTATANATLILNSGRDWFNETGTFVYNGCPSGGATNKYFLRYGGTNTYNDLGDGVNITENDASVYKYCQITVNSGISVNNLVFKPMIRLASITDDTYEPYTGGIASPNPNYEQPIYSAGDNENIFDKDNEEQFLQNLTPDNNGLIVSAQTSTTSANYIRTIIIPCKSDANYAITRFLGGKTFFIYESDEYPTLNKQTTLLKRNNDAGKVSEIIKTSATAKYLLVKIYNTYASEYYTYDELISSIKIEKGNKASGYTSYGMGSINEKIQTRNLFDKNTITEGKYIDNNGNFANDSSNFVSDFIKLLSINSNLSYRISATTGNAKRIGYYDDSNLIFLKMLHMSD